MVAYLNNWLIYGARLKVSAIVAEIQHLGFTINLEKSHLQPTSALIYLGLHINIPRQTIEPTQQCLQHLRDLIALVPQASFQDL